MKLYTTGCEAPQQGQCVIETYTHFIHILCAHNWMLLQLYVCIVSYTYAITQVFQQHAELDNEYVHTCSPLSANLQLVLAYTGLYICYWALDSYIVSCLLFCHIDAPGDLGKDRGAIIAASVMGGLVLLLLLVVVIAVLMQRMWSRSSQCQVPGNV